MQGIGILNLPVDAVETGNFFLFIIHYDTVGTRLGTRGRYKNIG